MTAAEFKKHRRRLGLSPQAMAAELDLAANKVRNIEAGLVPVPGGVQRFLRWDATLDQRRLFLAESGLPVCEPAEALELAAQAGEDHAARYRGFNELRQHTRECSACRRREKHLAQNPGLLEPPATGWRRIFGLLAADAGWLWARLVPAGVAGSSRRVSLKAAVYLLATGLPSLALMTAWNRSSYPSDSAAARDFGSAVLLLVPACLVFFYLMGWGRDLTRFIQHRPMRSAVRGSLLGLLSACGGFVARPPRALSDVLVLAFLTATMGVGGLIVGVVGQWWNTDRRA
jgi:hypothetical protein